MNPGMKLRVGICGGGIGGLTCALALSRFPDVEIDVYEAASQFGEIGAGIGVWPRTWRILQLLGLEPELAKIADVRPNSGPVPTFEFRKGDQPEGSTFYTMVSNGNLLTFHRAEFQQVLLRKLPPTCRTHCAKRLGRYTQSQSGVDLFFEDGSRASCDVLIGADGLKSSVRRTFLREKAQRATAEGYNEEARAMIASIEPTWSGMVAYRALIPGDRLRASAPGHRVFTMPIKLYVGKNSYIIAYPISRGKMINFVAFISRSDLENTRYSGPWVSVADPQEFISRFRHWEPEVQAMLNCVEKPLKWAIHTVRPLGSFVSGRVVLLGDAAHAMGPHQGSGAGQAIEDAYLLSTLLGHPRGATQRALRIYDEVRRPAANRVLELSRVNGHIFTLHHRDGADFDRLAGGELAGRLADVGRVLTRNWEWAWSVGVEAEAEQAVKRLERG